MKTLTVFAVAGIAGTLAPTQLHAAFWLFGLTTGMLYGYEVGRGKL